MRRTRPRRDHHVLLVDPQTPRASPRGHSNPQTDLVRVRHQSFYYHPTEQRHIVRLLLMPVVYAVCSFLSYMFYREALYFQLVRDCYEALVIASFFFLLLSYLSNPPSTPDHPVPHPYATRQEREAQLRESVKDLHLRKWMWPLGWLKWRPAGGGPGEGEVRSSCTQSSPRSIR